MVQKGRAMTPDKRQVLETVARCVTVMVHYQNSSHTAKTKELMVAEIEVIAGWVMELELDDSTISKRFLEPVQAELMERYLPKHAFSLNDAFQAAFNGLQVAKREKAGA